MLAVLGPYEFMRLCGGVTGTALEGLMLTVRRSRCRLHQLHRHFKGSGMRGVGGCSRWFLPQGDRDVLQHYREALPAAAWVVVEDDGRHVRAHVNGRAFDVMPCSGGGVIWAGSDDEPSFEQGRPEQAGNGICPHDL